MHWTRRHRRGRPPHPDVLTPAEWRVLEHVREGIPNAEIAVRLGITVRTVKAHVTSILAKTGASDRYALAHSDGRPAEASRAAMSRGFALPLAEWFTKGTAEMSMRVAAAGAVSVVFVASVFAVYGFFAEAAENGSEARLLAPQNEPGVMPSFTMRLIETVSVDEGRETSTYLFEYQDAEDWSISRLDDDGNVVSTQTPEPVEPGTTYIPGHWFMPASQRLARAQAGAASGVGELRFEVDRDGTRLIRWHDRECDSIVVDAARTRLCPDGGTIVETEEYRFDPTTGIPIYYGQSLGDELVHVVEAESLEVHSVSTLPRTPTPTPTPTAVP